MAAAAAGPSLIYLDEVEGRKLLADVRDGRHGCYQPLLHSIFGQQTTRAGCGIQSCALLLSANAVGCQRVNLSRQQGHSVSRQPSVPAKKRKTEDSVVDEPLLSKTSAHNLPSALNSATKQPVKEKDPRVGNPSSGGVFQLPYTEVGLYSMPQTLSVTTRELVASHGLTLAEVAGILRAHGCTVWVVYSSSSTADQFRRHVVDVLSAVDSCAGMVLNFHRGPLSSAPEKARKSHHSPVVAYHKSADRVLVLDTAAPVDRHFWASVDALFTAMLTVDHVSGKSRGYCFFVKSSA